MISAQDKILRKGRSMKRIAWTAMISCIGLLGCSQQPSGVCPSIERLSRSDPIEDAKKNYLKGDIFIYSLGGFVPSTPGAQDSKLTSRELENTTDTETAACRALRGVAEKYATAYNQTMVSLQDRKLPLR
jgi:hypothetical protein